MTNRRHLEGQIASLIDRVQKIDERVAHIDGRLEDVHTHDPDYIRLLIDESARLKIDAQRITIQIDLLRRTLISVPEVVG